MRRILQEEKNRERKRRVVYDLPLNLHAEFKNALKIEYRTNHPS
jgi:hypothetical protein